MGGQRSTFTFQVASITKPLASTNEMVDGGNVIITHKLVGMIERVGASTEKDILNYMKIEGESIPATRTGGACVIDVGVKDAKGISDDGFIAAKKTVKRHQGV